MLCYAADFETNVDPDDCRVWAWGLCKVGDVKRFEMGTDIASFIERIALLNNCRIYFHNLAFDGAFIFDYLLKNGWGFKDSRKLAPYEFTCLISDMNQVYSIKLQFEHGHYVDVYDSLKIMPMKLAQVAKSFGLDMFKGEIDYNLNRPMGHVLTEEEYDYLKRDVLILAKALTIMLNNGSDRMTAGSNAFAEYKRLMGGESKFRKVFPILSEDEDTFLP